MNKNTKFIIGASIAVILIFGTVLGATYGITKAFEPDQDKVVFHIDGKEYNLDEFETKKLLKDADNELTAKEQSNILLSEFYSLSLFGTSDYFELSGDKQVDNYIFKEGNDWNIPELLGSDPVSFKESFVSMKLLKETTDSSVSEYIAPLAKDNEDIQAVLLKIIEEHALGQNLFELYDTKEDIITDLIAALSKDSSYQKEVFEDIYVYSYLWQDSRKSMYDYNITEALVKSKASIVNQYNFDYDKLATGTLTTQEEIDESGVKVNIGDWTALATTITETAMTDNTYLNTLGTDYMAGFTGIQFEKGENTEVKEDFTDVTKTWDITSADNAVNGEATTTAGSYGSEDILKNGNYYLAKAGEGSNGKGAVLAGSKTLGQLQGNAKIISSSQLSPYVFGDKKVTSEGDEYVNNIKYSMFANGTDKLTLGTQEDHDEYIFDRWFGSDAALGEVYVSEALVAHDSNLSSSAYQYWYDNGFYIELSGTSSDKYLSFIPTDLIMKD